MTDRLRAWGGVHRKSKKRGGLVADLIACLSAILLWERACSRRRSGSQPDFSGCGAMLARDERPDSAILQTGRVIVDVLREQARSHSGMSTSAEARSAVRPPRFAFDPGAPLNHDGPSRRPTEQCWSEGMPSLGEAPSGGARALWLLSSGPAFRIFESDSP